MLSLERMLRLLSAIASYLHLQGHAPDDKSKQERTYALTKDSLCFVSNENGVSLAPILKLSSSTECLKRGAILSTRPTERLHSSICQRDLSLVDCSVRL
ncbi:hypothetical protein ACFX1Z_004763 [Malus domestica]